VSVLQPSYGRIGQRAQVCHSVRVSTSVAGKTATDKPVLADSCLVEFRRHSQLLISVRVGTVLLPAGASKPPFAQLCLEQVRTGPLLVNSMCMGAPIPIGTVPPQEELAESGLEEIFGAVLFHQHRLVRRTSRRN